MLPPCSFALLEGRAGFHIEGRGRPVVLLHSSLGSKGQWRALVERMRRSHRLIAIDLHGYGHTPMPGAPDAFGLRDEVALVESVLRVGLLPGERFHLVGHSYGATVALALAQARPHRLHSLVLFEPVSFHLLPPQHAARCELERLAADVAQLRRGGKLTDAAARFVDYWSGAGAFAQLPASLQHTVIGQLPKVELDFAAIARESSCADDHRRIAAPTCLLSGGSGPRPPQAVLHLLARVLPRASRHRVIGGHMAPVTHADLVNPVVDGFIRGVDALELAAPLRTAQA
jgi:pimeloyl-ACP methyl ester carboxylesterase